MLGLADHHETVTVVGDQFGSPTSASELAKAIAYLLPTDNFGIFHGTCEGATNWADFTREIYRLAGKKTNCADSNNAGVQSKCVRRNRTASGIFCIR